MASLLSVCRCSASTQRGLRLSSSSAVSELCQRSFLPFAYPSLSPLLQKAAALSTAAPPSRVPPLPHLPVPSIEHTMVKYLKSIKPLVDVGEYLNTERVIDNFLTPNGLGHQLQQLLQQRSKTTNNWLADWWLNTAYLEFRSPVVVWSSPGLVMPLQQWDTQLQQLKYAARLVADAVSFKTMLDNGDLPQEYSGADALDMGQYRDVLGTCRVPGVCSDTLVFHPQSKHIIVAHNGHFFRVDVYDSSGAALGEQQVYELLCQVVEHSQRPNPHPIGLLTTENRNVWGRAYNTLRKDRQNRVSLETIQSSLFIVCLDAANPSHLSHLDPASLNRQTVAALQCIHGNGARANATNRWYDKCVQFVVGAEGNVGITYEHSPAEGVPVARMMDFLVSERSRISAGSQSQWSQIAAPQRLDFSVDAQIETELQRAGDDLQMMVEDLDMACFTYTGYGKKFIKSQKMSPDSYIQMAIQLAYYRIHGEPGATYESAATRKFLHGRTETIRSCSEESVAFCSAMVDSSLDDRLKVETLRNAINAHKEYAKAAVNGLGCDRHMLGLKLVAIENGLDVPNLFMDESWAKSTHMKLSTSQVPVVADSFMCYGPLVPDGYGCCYNPRDTTINFGTSACNSSPATVAVEFRRALELSLNDMFSLMQRCQSA